ncbi:MAG: helix-turn-helix domain-containing protein [Hyphomicrobiaceae bacterium]
MKQISEPLADRYKNIILDGFDPVAAAGFTQVPNVILKSTDLSVGAKLAYAMLLSYAWQKDSCFPGQETLAADMGVSKRSVITFIKELDRAGFVSVKRQGLGQVNLYTLHAKVKPKRR